MRRRYAKTAVIVAGRDREPAFSNAEGLLYETRSNALSQTNKLACVQHASLPPTYLMGGVVCPYLARRRLLMLSAVGRPWRRASGGVQAPRPWPALVSALTR
eukprot:6185500-Pleurochrysis_carterae.AAC.3